MTDLTKLSRKELEELDRLLTMPPETRFAKDPVGWMTTALGIPLHTLRWSSLPEYEHHQWDGTPDPIATMLEALAQGKDVGVESATGTGKTFAAGAAALWFNATHENSLVVTTAPKEDQLTVQLWKEIGRHWPRFKGRYPMASTVKLRVRMREAEGESEVWSILGWACGVDANEESATRAQGFHAAHMLTILEETPGIPLPVLRAFQNTSVGAHNPILALGNPDNEQDTLHEFCLSPGVVHIRISALDHPNVVCGREVIPGACTQKSVDWMREKYQHDLPWMFDSRARGICPAQSTDALIKAEWVDRAFALWDNPEMHKGPQFRGVDVANSEAGDKAAIAKGQGRAIEVRAFACPSAVSLGDDIVTEFEADGVEARYVAVDTAGIGAATADQARRKGYRVYAFNGGADQMNTDGELDLTTDEKKVVSVGKFKSKRGQGYWQLRQDLAAGRLALKPNAKLKRELMTPTFQSRGGFIIVESKEDLKKRLGKSPDESDAVMYANWIRPRRAERIEEPEISAFAPEVLQAEFDRKYRFRARKGRPAAPDFGGY